MLFVLEMTGTVAFAISGALVGILKKMDIFGIAILGMTTAVGGGIIRDLILGINPPSAFRHPVYALTAIVISLIFFLPAIRKLTEKYSPAFEMTMRVIDSIGLGVFTVVGAQAAYQNFADCNVFLAVFLGSVTGVGGGVLRDIFAGNIPSIFVRHFYASASIIGALCFCFVRSAAGSNAAMISGAAIVVVLRLLAAKFRWTLPRA